MHFSTQIFLEEKSMSRGPRNVVSQTLSRGNASLSHIKSYQSQSMSNRKQSQNGGSKKRMALETVKE